MRGTVCVLLLCYVVGSWAAPDASSLALAESFAEAEAKPHPEPEPTPIAWPYPLAWPSAFPLPDGVDPLKSLTDLLGGVLGVVVGLVAELLKALGLGGR